MDLNAVKNNVNSILNTGKKLKTIQKNPAMNDGQMQKTSDQMIKNVGNIAAESRKQVSGI